MVYYGKAVSALTVLSAFSSTQGFTPVSSFISSSSSSSSSSSFSSEAIIITQHNRASASVSSSSKLLASTSLDQFFDEERNAAVNVNLQNNILEALEKVGEATLESLSQEDEEYETELQQRKRVVRDRNTGSFTVELSPASTNLGVRLAQIFPKLQPRDVQLDMDSLQMVSTTTTDSSATETSTADAAFEYMDISDLKKRLRSTFRGVVVAAVQPDSEGWLAGIRPGDVVVSTSDSAGDQQTMHPKSSLEGIKSAVSSSRSASSPLTLEFQRVETKASNQYELTLSRPTGLEIEEDVPNGCVIVTGIAETAPKLVKHAVRVGDRIVAVDSSMGDSLWPVSTVAGVISACTSRLPGQPVTMRFERPPELLEQQQQQQQTEATATTAPTTLIDSATTQTSGLSPEKRKQLLKRSRDLLRRYMPRQQSSDTFTGKFQLPAMVADKIVDAVASSSTSLDPPTLSMCLFAYLTCRQPDKALQLFEAAVGAKADGSVGEATQIHGHEKGTLVGNPKAMDAHTVSSLLKAHGMKGNLSAIKRVLCAIEGRAGIIVDESETAAWSGTRATGGAIMADTNCYNVALWAVAKAGPERVPDLLLLFDGMGDRKNLVSYNTVISALADAGMRKETFSVFSSLKKAGFVPDRYTYTALVKICKESSEMGSLLRDMRDKKVEPDILTYNTMIKTLCRQSQWQDARELILEMESVGVAPNSMTYGFLMTGLVRSKKYSACLALFETACADPETMSIAESVHLFTTAIAAASALENHEKAFELVNRMNLAGIKPDQKTTTALMGACMTSRKWSLAVEVYRKIDKPDGIAMTKGLEAMCHEGCFSEVLATLRAQSKRGGNTMSGRQLMLTYNHLIRESLLQGDLAAGRSVFTQILSTNKIPSSRMLQTIVEALDMVPQKKKKTDFESHREIPESHFDFLLFVLDSLTERNLDVDGSFYAATLQAGTRMGALRRKVCSLMTEARAVMENNDCKFRQNLAAVCTEPDEPVTWEGLLENYDTYKDLVGTSVQLPFLKVRLGKQQVRQVLLAEQAVGARKRKAVVRRRSEV